VNSQERLEQALEEKGYGERLLRDEPLALHTSFKIGGPADLFLVARRLDELQEWLQMARTEGVPSLVIGRGTNILVADEGIRGLVIANACDGFTLGDDGLLIAESGALLRELAQWTASRGWAGLQWAAGIPGTIGGAVLGNAGAYGGCMADIVRWASLLRPDSSLERVDAQALEYGYRTSALKRALRSGDRSIVLEVGLEMQSGDAEELACEIAKIAERRQARTPIGCCAGSIFKRGLQYPAGFLIEQAGLKGYRVGGAQVSPKHANFLMNVDRATAAEVKELIAIVQDKVWAAFGQRLEPEIDFVGEWS
jgi:UDP-N-acetylmuramate dehydrogenase